MKRSSGLAAAMMLAVLASPVAGCKPSAAKAQGQNATPSPAGPTPAPMTSDQVRLAIGGRGPYFIESGSEPQIATHAGPDGLSAAAIPVPPPDDWQSLATVRIYRGGVRAGGPLVAVGQLTVPRYSFLAWPRDRRIRLQELQPSTCDDAPAPTSGADEETRHIQRAVHWRMKADACGQRDEGGYAYLFALGQALGAEKSLLNFDPATYAISPDLRTLARRAMAANALCASGARPVCRNLATELRETRYAEHRLYQPLSRLRWQPAFEQLTDRELTGALQALRTAEGAYLECHAEDDPPCGRADFAGLRAGYCGLAEERKLLGRAELCATQARPGTVRSGGGAILSTPPVPIVPG